MKKTLLFGIIMLGLALVACNFSPPDTKPAMDNGIELGRRENLAVMKTLDRHKVGMDELQSMVEKMLNTSSEGRSVSPSGVVITGVKKLPLEEQRFTSLSVGRSVAGDSSEEPVEVYEFAVGNPGGDNEMFVLASDDIRVGNILAFAQGSLGDAPEGFLAVLQTGLQGYIAATILEYDSITGEEAEAALGKALSGLPEEARSVSGSFNGERKSTYLYIESDFTAIKGKGGDEIFPLLMTKWGQGTEGTWGGYVYNNYIQHAYGNMNFVTGCGPTAVAQIIAYHNHIPLKSLGLPSSFYNTNYGTWTGTFDLSQIRTMKTITNSSPMEAIGQVAMLMYYIGHTDFGNANYGNGSTSLATSNARLAFERLGYTVTNYDTKPTTVTGTTGNFTIQYNTSLATVKDALNKNRPIYFVGYTQTTKGTNGEGHAWVIDGWADMTYYREIRADGSVWSVNLSSNNVMVHCNLGWNGSSNGWYIYGLFDTTNPFFPDGSISSGNYNLSFDTTMFIPQKK
jgi:hypothetical protein